MTRQYCSLGFLPITMVHTKNMQKHISHSEFVAHYGRLVEAFDGDDPVAYPKLRILYASQYILVLLFLDIVHTFSLPLG